MKNLFIIILLILVSCGKNANISINQKDLLSSVPGIKNINDVSNYKMIVPYMHVEASQLTKTTADGDNFYVKLVSQSVASRPIVAYQWSFMHSASSPALLDLTAGISSSFYDSLNKQSIELTIPQDRLFDGLWIRLTVTDDQGDKAHTTALLMGLNDPLNRGIIFTYVYMGAKPEFIDDTNSVKFFSQNESFRYQQSPLVSSFKQFDLSEYRLLKSDSSIIFQNTISSPNLEIGSIEINANILGINSFNNEVRGIQFFAEEPRDFSSQMLLLDQQVLVKKI